MENGSERIDRWTWLWITCAALWNLFIIAAAFFVQSYSYTTLTTSVVNGTRTSTLVHDAGSTLWQVNGLAVLLPLLTPLVCVGIVALNLRHRQRTQKARVGPVAWTLTGLVAAICLVGVLTIGPFLSPVAIFLFVAVLRVHERSGPTSVAQVGVVTT